MPVVLRIGLLIFLCYVTIVLFLFFFQGRMVYYPSKRISSSPSDIGLPFRDVTFSTADGIEISGWMVGEDKARPVVLFCHGNAGNISHRLDTLAIFDRLGLNTFIFDYRGYGRSQGKPTEAGTYRDVEAAWLYLVENEGVPPERIILFGRSLGGAIAAYLAAKKNTKAGALILESTLTSVPDLGGDKYPFFPVRLLSRFQYNTRGFLKKITLPVLVIHSPQDEIIPFSHGKALFEAANEPRQFMQISGSHNEGFLSPGETYIQGLKKFVSLYCPAL